MTYAKKILAVSLVALMTAATAHAAEPKPDPTPAINGTVSVNSGIEADDSKLTKDVKRSLNKADNAMRKAADDVRAFFVDTKANALNPVSYRFDATTEGMIGESILNANGKKIATVEDILLSKSGSADKVVVADGGLLGIGEKLAAFDYGTVITQNSDDEVVMNITQADIDRAVSFSYDRDDADKAEVLSAGSISAKKLSGANVYNSDGKKVGDVKNVTIAGGEAQNLIISFDQTLGMGGDLAAIDYDSLNIAKVDGKVKVMLSQDQSRQFSDFRKMTRNK
jgi:sporulation protein YlmC with PRC-barrel domain